MPASAADQGPPEITNPVLLEARPPATRLQMIQRPWVWRLVPLKQCGMFTLPPSVGQVGSSPAASRDADRVRTAPTNHRGEWRSRHAVEADCETALPGKVEHWRIIRAGVRDTIALQLRKRVPAAKEPVGSHAATAQAYVDAYWAGVSLPVHLVAADTRVQVAVFQPGHRWDALMVFPEAGDYSILNKPSPIRTRYKRYIGDFVLHCHILDREDQGMMQNPALRCLTAMAASPMATIEPKELWRFT
jgi:hypothetical protein